MANTKQELESFAHYARQRLERGDDELTIDELFDLWRSGNPSPIARAEDTASIATAIEDFQNGDRGRPAGEVSQELRQDFGLAGGVAQQPRT